MKKARSKAWGCPGYEKFEPKMKDPLLAKKVAMGVKKGEIGRCKDCGPVPKSQRA
jgi:hypothetical protein